MPLVEIIYDNSTVMIGNKILLEHSQQIPKLIGDYNEKCDDNYIQGKTKRNHSNEQNRISNQLKLVVNFAFDAHTEKSNNNEHSNEFHHDLITSQCG